MVQVFVMIKIFKNDKLMEFWLWWKLKVTLLFKSRWWHQSQQSNKDYKHQLSMTQREGQADNSDNWHYQRLFITEIKM